MIPGQRILVLAGEEGSATEGWRRIVLTSFDETSETHVMADLDPEECWQVAQSLVQMPARPA